MTNYKEIMLHCGTCPNLEKCGEILYSINISDTLVPYDITCEHFSHLEAAMDEYINDKIYNILKDEACKTSLDYPLDVAHEALYQKSLDNPMIKQIKVTSVFWEYLRNKYLPITLNDDLSIPSSGMRAEFTGIPIVVDDEIERPFYEFVF